MKKILIVLLSAISLLTIGFSAVGIVGGAGNEGWSDISVPENLVIDDSLDLFYREVTVGGKSYEASVKLFYPDGSVVTKTENFTTASLSQAGVYRLVFEARDEGGKRHVDERKFTVADKLWRVENAKSSISYGHDALATEGTNGLLVKLAKGDVLSFGKIIDVSEITRATSLLTGFITPSKQGTYDFDRLVFTFTDVYDENCTLSFQGRRSLSTGDSAKGYSYWTAWGNGQTGSGYENGNFHHGDIWGTVYTHSFLAMNAGDPDRGIAAYPQPSDTDQFALKFDPNEMRTYIGNVYMTDLDDPLLHDGENIWTGFKSGKVFLTVRAYDYAGETANFCITSVLGYDLTAENVFTEKDPPVITVEVEEGYTDENDTFIPLAVVGGSFPVPAATSFDEYSGAREVKTAVYYNYADPYSRITCLIDNGRFKVENVGKYSIVYTATDAMGNSATAVYHVNSVSSLETPLSMTLDTEEATKEAFCGERVEIAGYETFGGSGERKVVITAELDSEIVTITEGVFVPQKAGVWKIVYTLTDITDMSVTASYELKVSVGDEPTFSDDPVFPKYFIAGMKNILPEIYAYDYSGTERKAVLASYEITDKNGTAKYNAGEGYVPEISGTAGEVSVKVIAGATFIEKSVKTIACIEDELLQIENLFVGSDFEFSRGDDGLTFSSKKSGDASWEFANPVAAKNSSVTIVGVKDKDLFDEMLVTFTDYLDSEISVTVRIINTKGKNAHIRFGSADRDIAQGFGTADNKFVVSYDGSDFYVGKIAVSVSETDGGKAFNGFPSKRVYVSVKITGAESGAGYRIESIDNNAITNLATDRTKPRIAVDGDYGGMRDLGEVYTVSSAVATDAVSPAVTFTLTVKTPNRAIAVDKNGKSLSGVDPTVSYDIVLSESGRYMVEYTAIDENGNKATLSYGINILDSVAPTVKIGSVQKTAKVGETIVLPDVTVTDDVTAPENLVVYRTVRTPNGILTVLGNDKEVTDDKTATVRYSYTFLFKGEYKFMVLAMDEAGNQTLAEFTVTVE